MTGRVLVCVPTFNERASLGGVVARVRTAAPDVDLLVIDDASPDGTGALAEELAGADAAVHVLHRAGKSGLGSAYVAGFGWALAHGYGTVVEMDADGSHQPEELPALLAPIAEGRADVVLGSRYVPGGRLVGWPRRREVLSRGGNTYVRLALGLPLRDATGGFRAYRSDVLADLGLESVASQGYCFQVDMVWRAWLAGAEVLEVPITFVERAEGVSKMTGPIVREALVRVTRWGLHDRWTAPRRRQSARPTRAAGRADADRRSR